MLPRELSPERELPLLADSRRYANGNSTLSRSYRSIAAFQLKESGQATREALEQTHFPAPIDPELLKLAECIERFTFILI